MKKVKAFFEEMIFTTKGRMFLSMVLVALFGAFSTHSTIIETGFLWCDYAMAIVFMYPFGFGLFMLYKGVSNGIKNLLNKRKS